MITPLIVTLLPFLKISICLKTEEIHNNIISFNGPKTYIVEKDHILMYHYNLSQFKLILSKHEEIINEITNKNETKEIMVQYLLDSSLNQLISNKQTLEELIPARHKRGLINIGGRISKFLFGTLDDEDESLYQEYFQKLQNNVGTIETSQNQVISVINSISNRFQNQTNIMVQQMNKFMKLQQILDKIILLQFEQIKISRIFAEINTAVSFARLHLLHESILPLNYFRNYVQNNDLLRHLIYLKDFYSVCFTSVKIQNEQILFVIRVPLVNPIPFETYELKFIPFLNTYPIDQPKYLLIQQEEIKWSLYEDCQHVEEWMLCPQNKLVKPPLCYSEFVKEKRENCSRQSAQEVNDLILLPDGNYLSVFNDLLKENCSGHLSYEHEPRKILLVESKCHISNGHKTFHPSTTNHVYHQFQLNNMNFSHIQDLIIEPLNVSYFAESNLYKWNLHPNYISSLYFIFLIICLIGIFIILYKVFIIKFSKLIEKQSSTIEIELSSLKGGGNM